MNVKGVYMQRTAESLANGSRRSKPRLVFVVYPIAEKATQRCVFEAKGSPTSYPRVAERNFLRETKPEVGRQNPYVQKRPSPKPMMHIAYSPLFQKNYKCPHVFVRFKFFCLIRVFASPQFRPQCIYA